VLVVAAVASASCAHANRAAPAPEAVPAAPTGAPPSPGRQAEAGGHTTVAEAKVASVAVFRSPGDTAPATRLSNPNEDGAPRVFVVTSRQGPWLDVELPVRPNGSQGWIRASDVTLTDHDYRIRIRLGAHRITVWRANVVIDDEAVGVGRDNTPTPGGEYFITELLEQPNPSGVYGPYAYGLSGYSNVLATFAGGNGAIGLHGTNDPAGLGRDVSHGCIRMSNAGITKLAKELPLGTPVTIEA
jgi:lipoprotein-anchoring transpeptidase ErfK/SrfK